MHPTASRCTHHTLQIEFFSVWHLLMRCISFQLRSDRQTVINMNKPLIVQRIVTSIFLESGPLSLYHGLHLITCLKGISYTLPSDLLNQGLPVNVKMLYSSAVEQIRKIHQHRNKKVSFQFESSFMWFQKQLRL